MLPKTDGLLESSLYVSDVPRSVRFYEETFGFRVSSEFGERGCAMHAGTRQVLLLFKKGASRAMQSPHVRLCDRVGGDKSPLGTGPRKLVPRFRKPSKCRMILCGSRGKFIIPNALDALLSSFARMNSHEE